MTFIQTSHSKANNTATAQCTKIAKQPTKLATSSKLLQSLLLCCGVGSVIALQGCDKSPEPEVTQQTTETNDTQVADNTESTNLITPVKKEVPQETASSSEEVEVLADEAIDSIEQPVIESRSGDTSNVRNKADNISNEQLPSYKSKEPPEGQLQIKPETLAENDNSVSISEIHKTTKDLGMTTRLLLECKVISQAEYNKRRQNSYQQSGFDAISQSNYLIIFDNGAKKAINQVNLSTENQDDTCFEIRKLMNR